ncbi:MAG TPA: hypothetical protein VN788_11980 [Verrucomicrobiae bacterium]|nr:hypothetical protein [Verrucomicrobiae bacterium]
MPLTGGSLDGPILGRTEVPGGASDGGRTATGRLPEAGGGNTGLAAGVGLEGMTLGPPEPMLAPPSDTVGSGLVLCGGPATGGNGAGGWEGVGSVGLGTLG